MIRRFAAIILCLSFCAFARANQPRPDESLLRAFVAAFNSGEQSEIAAFVAQQLAREALAKRSAEQLAAGFVAFQKQTGSLAIRQFRPTDDGKVTALVQSEVTEAWFEITLNLARELFLDRTDPRPEHAIRDIGFAFGEPPSPVESSQRLSASEIATRAKRYVDDLAAAGMFSGGVLVAHGAQPLFAAHYGAGSIDTPRSIASVGKVFTSISIARLEAAGKLSLDDPIGRLLPNYPNEEVRSRVMVRHLLSHTSGLPDYMQDPEYQARRAARPLSKLDDYVPYFATKPLRFGPGEKYEYSNSGYLVLGLIVEQLSGRSFHDYVAATLFRPAKMSATPVETVRPAGGELTNVADMHHFGTTLLRGALLPPDVAQRVMNAERVAGRVNRYGVEVTTLNGHRIVGHGGAAPGISAGLDLYPDDGYIVVVISTVDQPASEHVMTKLRRLIASGRRRMQKE